MSATFELTTLEDLVRDESYQVFIDGREDLFIQGIDLENKRLRVYTWFTKHGSNLTRLKVASTVELLIHLAVPFRVLFEIENVELDDFSLGCSEEMQDDWDDDDLEDRDTRKPPKLGFAMTVTKISLI